MFLLNCVVFSKTDFLVKVVVQLLHNRESMTYLCYITQIIKCLKGKVDNTDRKKTREQQLFFIFLELLETVSLILTEETQSAGIHL